MLCRVAALVFLCLSAFFAFAFHERYWRWRDCFNELGRCYDEVSQDVYLEQAGVAWASLTVVCLVVALLMAFRARRG